MIKQRFTYMSDYTGETLELLAVSIDEAAIMMIEDENYSGPEWQLIEIDGKKL